MGENRAPKFPKTRSKIQTLSSSRGFLIAVLRSVEICAGHREGNLEKTSKLKNEVETHAPEPMFAGGWSGDPRRISTSFSSVERCFADPKFREVGNTS